MAKFWPWHIHGTSFMDLLIENSSWEEEVILRGYSNGLIFANTEKTTLGGDMGSANEDFEVTEVPAYEPCGCGEHRYLWIEKSGKSTLDATKAIERAFGVSEIDVGCAGKKDAHAVTRQWISIHTANDSQEPIEKLQTLGWLKVLKDTRHANKLRMGHLRGNAFKVRLYGVDATRDAIFKVCQNITERGFINYFGKQRFGFDGGNVAQGMKLLCGGHARRQMKQLYISAIQSALFNLAAARRFADIHDEVRTGDIMQKINAGCFACNAPQIDQRRANLGEIGITLELPGKKAMHATGYARTLEDCAADDFIRLWQAHMPELDNRLTGRALSQLAVGDRRLFMIRPSDMHFEQIDHGIVDLYFSLPSGAYATILLRHICGPSFTR